jgi:hypothetical protein
MISTCLVFFAQVPGGTDVDVLRKATKPSAFSSPELLIVLISALALSALLFVWAFFIRKRPKSARGSLVVERASKGSQSDTSHRRRRKRKPEHPDNWGRNPTLGETGGLPPLRENPPDDGANSNASAGNEEGPRTIRPR